MINIYHFPKDETNTKLEKSIVFVASFRISNPIVLDYKEVEVEPQYQEGSFIMFILWQFLLGAAHISDQTNEMFGEILNRKGSSGTIDFHHDIIGKGTLNVTVQSNNRNESSQT